MRLVQWFKITPQRRTLIVTGFAALAIFGSLFIWQYRVMRTVRDRAKAAGLIVDDEQVQKRQAQWNEQFIQDLTGKQELDAIETELAKADKFMETAEAAYSKLDPSDTDQQTQLDQSVDKAIKFFKNQQAKLEDMLVVEAIFVDRDRAKVLKERCSALIDRLNKLKTTSRKD